MTSQRLLLGISAFAWTTSAYAQTVEQGSSPPLSADPSPESAAEAAPEVTSADDLVDVPRPGFWEGGGVRLTEGTVLHPSVALTTSYQTNVFFQDSADGPSGPVGAALFVLTAGASWGTMTPARLELEAPGGAGSGQRIAFNLDLSLSWNQYASSDSEIVARSDLGIGFLGNVVFNPQGAFSLELRDGFLRNVSPGQSLRENADRDRNELDAAVHWRPGGGAIDTYFQYAFVLDIFESSILNYNDRMTHTGSLGARWQWLPRTQFQLESNFGIVTPSNQILKSSSTPFRVYVGASTLLTPVLGLVARAGYGNGFYASGESPSTYLALLEARYAIGPTIRTAAGYSHDFADALIGNYYLEHVFYLRFGMQIGDRWQARARAEVRLLDYGNIHDTMDLMFCGDAGCSKSRDDLLARIELSAEVLLTRWLIGGASYVVQLDSTDFFVQSGTAIDRGSYLWQEFLLKVAARF